MPEPSSYTRRVFAKAFQETASFTNRKLLVSAFMAVIVRLAFWRFAQTQATWGGVWQELWHDCLIIIGSYATVILGSFVVNLVRAPFLLDIESQSEIARLSKRLELPDKALAEHLGGLLTKIGDHEKRVLQLVLLYDEINISHLKIEGMSSKEITDASRKCLSVGLLRFQNEAPDPSSPLAFLHSYYFVPHEFRETLKRLLYTTPGLSSSAIVQT